jgi:thiamine-monophosphate kinase
LSVESSNNPPGEFDLIAQIKAQAIQNAYVALGIGDDCAALRFRRGAEVLVTTDMLMEGRHFLRDTASFPEIGYKALAVNLSDIAAMAGIPVAALVSVALPRHEAEAAATGLMLGMKRLANDHDLALIGGDTNAWNGPLVISITVIGEASERGAVRRDGAKPGDVIFVTGRLGGSLLGRHLRPRPRVREALAIHEDAEIRAMIDLSDGLAGDLAHILKSSGSLGATLDADDIPVHPDAYQLAIETGRHPLDHAMTDGEDFELCFTVAPVVAAGLLAYPPDGATIFKIGVVESEPGLRVRYGPYKVVPYFARGFDHLADPLK